MYCTKYTQHIQRICSYFGFVSYLYRNLRFNSSICGLEYSMHAYGSCTWYVSQDARTDEVRFDGLVMGDKGCDRGLLSYCLYGEPCVITSNTSETMAYCFPLVSGPHRCILTQTPMSHCSVYMCLWTGSSMVQIITCRLINTKLSNAAVLTYC